MKKLSLLILICITATQFSNAQNKKIYVSKQGGKPSFLHLGKLGYNQYTYTNYSKDCDTLICKGSGYKLCKLDKSVFGEDVGIETKFYDTFNTAIHKAEKHIRKTKIKSGYISLVINGNPVNVAYYNADKLGNADLHIQIQEKN